VSWVFRAQATASGTTDLTITKPTGTIDGDVMIMILAHRGAGFATLPAGWTVIEQEVSAAGARAEMAWKRASSEGANYAVADMANVAVGAILTFIGGLASGDVVSASTVRANAALAGLPYTDELTVADENVLIIGARVRPSTSTGGTFVLSDPNWHQNSSYLLGTRVDTSSSTGDDISLAVATGLWGIPGNIGAFTRTLADGTENVSILAALKVEPPADPLTVNRFYFTKRAAGTRLIGPLQGDWHATDSTRAKRGDPHWTFLLAPVKDFGGVSDGAYLQGDEATDGLNDHIVAYRWATPLLAEQTLSGTLQVCLRVRYVTNQSVAARYVVHAYITQGDTMDVRTTLANSVVDAGAWSTTATWRSLSSAIALSGDVEAGDRIVIEIGAECEPNVASDNQWSVQFGTLNDEGCIPWPDAVATTTSSDQAAWAEFSSALELQDNGRGTPPANDACADAVSIASLPYESPRIDTTGSLGAHRGVWYTFTPDFSGIVHITTFGGNYSNSIRVFSGSCGSKVFAGNFAGDSRKVAWEGRSQSVYTMNVVSGTQYWIEVQSRGWQGTVTNTALFAPLDDGGSLVVQVWRYLAPQDDDLFVDCQHVVCYRAGQMINIQTALYDLTPTNNAVDYTLREMDDQNGGTHSLPRLYVNLFGPTPRVVILDLATLNIGEFQIDDIELPLNPADASQNLASLVFNNAGVLYLGFFGDNYDVVGELSSAAGGAVREIDAVNADNQTGAPFADAVRHDVAFDRSGSDYVELAADQETLFYTSAGRKVKRWNVATQTQMADFAELPAPTSEPRPYARGLRLLPPGDGTEWLLVCYGDRVLRLDAGGDVIQTYTPSPSSRAQDLDKIEFNSDATRFWVSDQWTCDLFEFEVESGTQLDRVITELPPAQLCGFSIYGGFRAGLQEPPEPEPTAFEWGPCPPVASQPVSGQGDGQENPFSWPSC
jgi:hypothetical protein